MAEQRRPRKPAGEQRSGSRRAGKPGSGKPGADKSGKPSGAGTRRGQGGASSDGRGSGRTDSRSGAGRGGGRAWSREGGQRRGDRREESRPRTQEQQRYDGPEIPEHITGKELDRSVHAQLASLPEKLALRVARHLVAAGQLIDSDPATAYQHTLAARARASRLAVVREAVGEAAYAAGEYAEALTELRAAKRMNGAHDYVAMMADCERALKRPDRALALVRNAPREALSAAANAELTIVEAGARRDRGESDAALRTLERAPLSSRSREPWVARLRYAYADTLEEAGRLEDALEWFHRTEAVDVQEATDAAERASALEGRLG